MGSLFSQIGAVVMLNLKSIPQRLAMSAATIVAVAMAVAVLLGFLALSEGFKATMEGTGATDVAVVNRKGATSELSSILTAEQVRLLETGPGVRLVDGKPLISAELYLVVDGIKRSSGQPANIPLRGMNPEGLSLRENVELAEGRMFAPGTNEIVVGRKLLQEFAGFELNKSVRLGSNTWLVVGVFEAPGTVFESELWADARVVQSLFNRGTGYQIARVAMASPAALESFATFVEDDARLQLQTRSERDFYAAQAEGTGGLIRFIGWPLGITMAIGALAGALNTMFSSVAARSSEIATLRIIGFSGVAAFAGTLVEALALSLIGALVGTIACIALFGSMTTSTLGANFTQVVFQLKITPDVLLTAFIVALVIGLVGGVFPGIRAARQSPLIGLTS
jgi:putative ABC transport system permease protein